LRIRAKLLSARAKRSLIVHEPEARSLGALPTAMGGVTRLAYAHAHRAGVDLAPLLAQAGLSEREVLDQHARIKVRNQIGFLNLVAHALADPFLGFHLAPTPDLRVLGLLYYVVASSATFAGAWRAGARYTAVVNEGVSLGYHEGATIDLTFDYVGVPRHVDRHQIEFCMAALLRLCRELTGRVLAPRRVAFIHHRNEDAAELAMFFGCKVAFGATADRMTFDAAVGDVPIVTADPYLNELLIKNAEEALARRPRPGGSFRAQVENTMIRRLPHGEASADAIAAILGVSRRTFARRLAAEGATFTDVLEGLRGDLARQYLADRGLSVSQVAWLVGYQEVSAFTHAFKRWTGKTPRQARNDAAAAA
jgi:AraC-like DNA-binding protein